MLALVLLLAIGGCGSGDDDAKQEAAARARARAQAAQQARMMAVGRRLFVKNCALCHTIEGRTAHPTFIESPIPSLDEVRPRRAYVEERIVNGGIDMSIFRFDEPELRSLVTYVFSVAGSRVRDTGADEPEAVRQGEQVYLENCQRCHAIDGRKANGRWIYPGTDFNKVKPSQKMVREQVLKGAPEKMPSYRGRLSKAELHALAVYVTATAGS